MKSSVLIIYYKMFIYQQNMKNMFICRTYVALPPEREKERKNLCCLYWRVALYYFIAIWIYIRKAAACCENEIGVGRECEERECVSCSCIFNGWATTRMWMWKVGELHDSASICVSLCSQWLHNTVVPKC